VRTKTERFGGIENVRAHGRSGGPKTTTEEHAQQETQRVAIKLGLAVHEERIRRRMTLGQVAERSGLGVTTVHDVESGRFGSLETYVRLADALRLRAEFELVDPRRREPAARRAADPVHAAMGEAEAAHLRGLGFAVGMDEPFQHYQFAGRADVVAWSAERAALLHIENRTRFPDIQEAFGSFNAKRRYLGQELGARAGIAAWRTETHVMAALWSAEILHTLRTHESSFASVCPDPPAAFEAWWRGEPPAPGPPAAARHSALLLFDPIDGGHRDRCRWVGRTQLSGLRPRYRDYADAVGALGFDGS
jgi:transcriptional regulator with XRE-family HTH domain